MENMSVNCCRGEWRGYIQGGMELWGGAGQKHLTLVLAKK